MIINYKSIITEIENNPCPKGIRSSFDGSAYINADDQLDIWRRKISNEEINQLPICQYAGEIVLVQDEKHLESAISTLKKEDVLGFDTETQPVFSKGKNNFPSLLQLAGADIVYLFQLNNISFGAAMAEILENPAIIKSGVAVRDDILDLQRIHSFKPANFVDLSQIAKQNRLETRGLRNLAANFFSLRVPKGARCSNWALTTLSQKQLLYAATDAWIGRELYLIMYNKGLSFN